MKTKIQILTALLVMNLTLLYAGDPKINIMKADLNKENISFNRTDLAPVTPKEAFFNDSEAQPVSEISFLAPITPKEAIFEDYNEEFFIQSLSQILKKIAPETPDEAEFDNDVPILGSGIESLVPLSPGMASF
jgi:hypothetical protein